MALPSRASKIFVAGCLWLAALGLGWLSRPRPSPKARAVPVDAPAAPETTIRLPPVTAVRAPAAKSPAARPVLYPHMVLTDEEKEILTLTPEEAVAKGDAMGASAQHIARCREFLPDPPELCEKLDVTMHHLRLADMKNLREFLSGTLEADQFQAQHHRNMLAWQLEMESYLSYDQMMRYPGVEPGDDPFLVVTAWGIGLPPGYTIGEDILMRRPGENGDPNQPDNPRDPWSYAKKVAHGETP